jgi:EpsI family protein
MQHPLVSDHLSFGWMLFGGLVFLLLVLDLVLSRSGAGAGTTDAVIAPAGTCRYGPGLRSLLFAVSLLLIISAPVLALWARQPLPLTSETRLVFPPATQGWSGPSETHDSWMPEYHGAIAALRAYHRDDDEVYLYIGYYPRQSQGHELINETNHIANTGVWQTEPLAERAVSVDERPVLERVIISPTGRQRLVWYWYRVGESQTTNRYSAKALQVLGMLTGRTRASVIAVAVDIETGKGDAQRLLRDFVSVMGRPIAKMLDGDGAS